MRKLALLLGSLLVVASASAKEVVPAPVVVEEAPVQVIEKEVIVYRDKEEGFKPNGYLDLSLKFMGKTENHDYADWHTRQDYSQTQLVGNLNMTENQSLYFRVRTRHDWNASEAGKGSNDMGTQTRLRYAYDHGYLGDSKVNFNSRVWYEDGYTGTQKIQYFAAFNFVEYMFSNDYIKTTDFTVAPRYTYEWDSNNDAYVNRFGLYVNIEHQLPWGFSTQLEIDGLEYNMYGQDQRVGTKKNDTVDDDFRIQVGAYLYHGMNLYANDKVSVDWKSAGGYDTYEWHSEDIYGYALDARDEATRYDDANYEAYIDTTVTVSYQATPSVKVYGYVGGEYRNWTNTTENTASNWRWQPYVGAGFRTSF